MLLIVSVYFCFQPILLRKVAFPRQGSTETCWWSRFTSNHGCWTGKETRSTHQRWVPQLASSIGNHANTTTVYAQHLLVIQFHKLYKLAVYPPVTSDLRDHSKQPESWILHALLFCIFRPPLRKKKHVTEQVSAEWFDQIVSSYCLLSRVSSSVLSEVSALLAMHLLAKPSSNGV